MNDDLNAGNVPTEPSVFSLRAAHRILRELEGGPVDTDRLAFALDSVARYAWLIALLEDRNRYEQYNDEMSAPIGEFDRWRSSLLGEDCRDGGGR